MDFSLFGSYRKASAFADSVGQMVFEFTKSLRLLLIN